MLRWDQTGCGHGAVCKQRSFICSCQCEICMSAFEVAWKESPITQPPGYRQHLFPFDGCGFDGEKKGVKRKPERVASHQSLLLSDITLPMLCSIKQWAMWLFRKWQNRDISPKSKNGLNGCGTSRSDECVRYVVGEPFAHQKNKLNIKPYFIHWGWQH